MQRCVSLMFLLETVVPGFGRLMWLGNMPSPRASISRLPTKSQARASVLFGAMLYVKGRTIPELTAESAKQLRLPESLGRSQRVEARTLSGALRTKHAPLAALPVGGANSAGNYSQGVS
jgi:hypothetical protein